MSRTSAGRSPSPKLHIGIAGSRHGAVQRLGMLRPGVSPNRAADIIWFHFGFNPLRERRTARRIWSDAEQWLHAQAVCEALVDSTLRRD